jgi:TatD DNase family protein
VTSSSDEPVRQRREGGRSRDTTYPELPEPLPVPVVDSHCHLDIRDGDSWLGVEDALRRAREVGVRGIVQVGCDLPSARWSVDTATTYEHIVATVALHPNEAPEIEATQGRAALEDAWAEIDALAAEPRVRAVGETGLDFYRTAPEGRDVQEESFRRHIAMAKKHGKALMIHDRDAHDDVVRVLDSEGAPDIVVFHCFSGGPELARICADRGWVMSFAGTVTFRNAQPLRDALAIAPIDLVLVETDAPFLAPMPFRGRPNASYLIPHTLRAMAEVMRVTVDVLGQHVEATTARSFGPF